MGVQLNDKTKLLCFGDATLGAEAGVTGVDAWPVLGVPNLRLGGGAGVPRPQAPDGGAGATARVLPQLPFTEAMLILRGCVSVRADYLMSQLPTGAQQRLASVWDPSSAASPSCLQGNQCRPSCTCWARAG